MSKSTCFLTSVAWSICAVTHRGSGTPVECLSIQNGSPFCRENPRCLDDIDDYLANLSVGFEEARRFLDLFKRERARDDWPQLPRSEPHCDESFCALEGSFVVRDLPV